MNISVSTTSSSGYTLSIASSTGSTDLTNQSDSTKKINSISSPISESDFSNSSNTQYNNKWGYKPSQYVTMNGDTPVINQNTNFRPLPGTNGEIIAKTEKYQKFFEKECKDKNISYLDDKNIKTKIELVKYIQIMNETFNEPIMIQKSLANEIKEKENEKIKEE